MTGRAPPAAQTGPSHDGLPPRDGRYGTGVGAKSGIRATAGYDSSRGHPCLGWRCIRRTPPTRESARAKRCHPVPQRGPALPLLGDDPSRSKGRARVSVATCPVEHERVGRGRGHHLPNMWRPRLPEQAKASRPPAGSQGGTEPRARKFGPAQGYQGEQGGPGSCQRSAALNAVATPRRTWPTRTCPPLRW